MWLCQCFFFDTVVGNNLAPISTTGLDLGVGVEESINEADAELYRRVRKK